MEQGTTEKCKCQRYVERFGKAHKNQSGGLGITEKFLRRKNVYFVEGFFHLSLTTEKLLKIKRNLFRGLAKNLRFVCRDRQKGRRMTEQSPKLCYNKLLESFMYLEDLYGREKYRGHRI